MSDRRQPKIESHFFGICCPNYSKLFVGRVNIDLSYGNKTDIDHGGGAGECAGGEGVEALDDARRYYAVECGIG